MFNCKVLAEGSKRGPRITVPAVVVNELRAKGWQPPGWLKLHVSGFEPIFVYGRFPACRPSLAVSLPAYRFAALKIDDEVTVQVEPAEKFRARGTRSGFDWLPLVDERYFPVDDGDELVLWSRHEEPFRLRRVADSSDSFWWLLGLYQAEGSKADTAMDWTLGGASASLMAAVPPTVEALGIPRDRQYCEVLHAVGESPRAAERAFAEVNLHVAATRLRTGAGEHAIVLHVKNSKPLLRLFKAALAKVFAPDWRWPSKEAAKQYALGWLDGDGTISVMQNTGGIELRLAGYRNEQEVVLAALEAGFSWDKFSRDSFGSIRSYTARTLQLDYAAQLAIQGAFIFSMSRARLISALEKRLSAQAGRKNNWKGRSLTSATSYKRAQQLFDDHLREEFSRLQTHPLAATGFITGSKGQPYPLKEKGPRI